MKNSQKGVTLLLLAVIVASAIGGIFYYARENPGAFENILHAIRGNAADAPRANIKASLNPGWNIYANSDFSIEYPPEWKIIEDSKTRTVDIISLATATAKEGVTIHVYHHGTGKSDKTVDAYLAEARKIVRDPSQNYRETHVSFGGITAVKIDFDFQASHQAKIVFGDDDSNTYIISNGILMLDENLFAKIFASFRFL